MSEGRGNRAAVAISAGEAAALVKSGHWIDYGFGLSQPDLFDHALAGRAFELSDVKIRSALTLSPRATFEADPEGRHFHFFSWHFSAYDRKQHDAGRCNYIPMNFGETPDYYRRFIDPIDVVCIKTAPRDDQGSYNRPRPDSLLYPPPCPAPCNVSGIIRAASDMRKTRRKSERNNLRTGLL
jgi:acyl-CoA hydrolase